MAQSTLRLISWNVAGWTRNVDLQLEVLRSRLPDIVALQEVRPSMLGRFQHGLEALGLGHIEETVSQARQIARRDGVLVASRWPVQALARIQTPHIEQTVSVGIESQWGPIELHCAHVPPGASNGWVKIETLEAIYARLACSSPIPRILCGDFNTPQQEWADGTIVTWAQRVALDGRTARIAKMREPDGSTDGGPRWDRGERNVLSGLAAYNLSDVYRAIHGYSVQEYSWYWRAKGREIGRRFDHIFAAQALNATACEYFQSARLQGFSDHAPIEATFAPQQSGA